MNPPITASHTQPAPKPLLTAKRRIDALLDIHPDAPILLSFLGIGPILAATLIAEMGDDRSHYPEAQVRLAEAGLSPVTQASGRMHQVRCRYGFKNRTRHVSASPEN